VRRDGLERRAWPLRRQEIELVGTSDPYLLARLLLFFGLRRSRLDKKSALTFSSR